MNKTTRFKHINTRSFDTTGAHVLEGGDAFQLFQATAELDITFYSELGTTILEAQGVTDLNIDFVKQGLTPYARYFVRATAGTVTPDMYMSTGLGVLTQRLSGIFAVERRSSVIGGPKIVSAGAEIKTIAANANRVKLNVRAALSAVNGAYGINTATDGTTGDADTGIPLYAGEVRTWTDYKGPVYLYFPAAALELYYDEEFT